MAILNTYKTTPLRPSRQTFLP